MTDLNDLGRHGVDIRGYDDLRRPGKTLLETAIAFSEEHREVHVIWLERLRRSASAREKSVGYYGSDGIEHNEIAIKRYNVILQALNAAAAMESALKGIADSDPDAAWRLADEALGYT